MWRWLYKVVSTKFKAQTYMHVLDFWVKNAVILISMKTAKHEAELQALYSCGQPKPAYFVNGLIPLLKLV